MEIQNKTMMEHGENTSRCIVACRLQALRWCQHCTQAQSSKWIWWSNHFVQLRNTLVAITLISRITQSLDNETFDTLLSDPIILWYHLLHTTQFVDLVVTVEWALRSLSCLKQPKLFCALRMYDERCKINASTHPVRRMFVFHIPDVYS